MGAYVLGLLPRGSPVRWNSWGNLYGSLSGSARKATFQSVGASRQCRGLDHYSEHTRNDRWTSCKNGRYGSRRGASGGVGRCAAASSSLQSEYCRRLSVNRMELRLCVGVGGTAAQVTAGLRGSQVHPGNIVPPEGVKIMKRKALALLVAAIPWTTPSGVAAQTQNSAEPRHITLHEAVELALKHNHAVRLAGFSVDEKK